MDWSAVNAVLSSLPATYLRSGSTFTSWQNSVVAGAAKMTNGVDSIAAQVTFQNATGNWLNVWGRMLGVIRNSNESDTAYSTRISNTMLAWRGTVPGIEAYASQVLGFSATVTENLPSVGWNLILPYGTALSSYQEANLPANLAFVRPAGVPYTIRQVSGGLFLSTGNFLSGTMFPGSWLKPVSEISGYTVPSTTNNLVPTLPTTWLTDPTINPSLAA